jgi:hypothetical protein
MLAWSECYRRCGETVVTSPCGCVACCVRPQFPHRVTSDKTHTEHNESAVTLIADITGGMDFRQNFTLALAKRKVATLLVDVGESRFENVTDWLPRAAVELNKSQLFDRPKVPRSSADFDP